MKPKYLLTGLAFIAASTLSPCSGRALIDPHYPHLGVEIKSICPSKELGDHSIAITYEIDVDAGDTPQILIQKLNPFILGQRVTPDQLLDYNGLPEYREVCIDGEERSGPQEDDTLHLWTDKLEYTITPTFNPHQDLFDRL